VDLPRRWRSGRGGHGGHGEHGWSGGTGGSTGDGALRGASGPSAGGSSPSDSGETSVEAHLRYSASFPPAARGHVGVDGGDHGFSAGTTLRLTICQRCSSAASRSACSTWPSLSWAVTQACALPGERGQDGPAAQVARVIHHDLRAGLAVEEASRSKK